jgi:hypothetical protein
MPGSVRLARHHVFRAASQGQVACVACGRSYDMDNGWQAEIDPCLDGEPTGISVEEAQQRWAARLAELGPD